MREKQRLLTKLVGWSMALCFVVCALPQLVKTYMTQDVTGISLVFWVIWGLGEALGIAYVIFEYLDLKQVTEGARFQWPLFINYLFNLIIIGLELFMYWLYV